MSLLDEMILDQTIITKALTWLQITVKKPNDFINSQELARLDKVCHDQMVKLNMLENEAGK